MCIDLDCFKNFEPAPIKNSDARYREKNRELLREKASKYRELNGKTKNHNWKLARREKRQNETIEEREIRLAKRRLYRANKRTMP